MVKRLRLRYILKIVKAILQTANVAYFQRKIQLSGFSAYPDGSAYLINLDKWSVVPYTSVRMFTGGLVKIVQLFQKLLWTHTHMHTHTKHKHTHTNTHHTHTHTHTHTHRTAISEAGFLRFRRERNRLQILFPPRSNHTAFPLQTSNG